MTELAKAVLAGQRLALARLLTQVENDTPQGREALNALFPHTGRAHLVGITGAPGTGKSTLVSQLVRAYRQPQDGSLPSRMGVVAVDPTSPFTGGALLGDRVRMRDLSGDPGVFIRSMATRGALGGLAQRTAAVVQVLDAAGFDVIFIETVGAGQSEVDIARLALTTLVIAAPGAGDDIQASKAGILEIADILVVNKADQPGVDSAVRALQAMLGQATAASGKHLLHAPQEDAKEETTSGWEIPVLRTTATSGEGVHELVTAIRQHQDYLKESGNWEQRDQTRLQSELQSLLQSTLLARWRETVCDAHSQQTLDLLAMRKISPLQAVERLLENNQL
ncbi:MAG: methylmalonyl Co-A mutase-associated GTPase MeaB [Anaerolineaceae bacterium]|nr:methylmalonyl Co-A mutase-associated GTPase MeaB [Anaerolineaceae bacterium]